MFARQRSKNLPSAVSGDLDHLNQPSYVLAKIPGREGQPTSSKKKPFRCHKPRRVSRLYLTLNLKISSEGVALTDKKIEWPGLVVWWLPSLTLTLMPKVVEVKHLF